MKNPITSNVMTDDNMKYSKLITNRDPMNKELIIKPIMKLNIIVERITLVILLIIIKTTILYTIYLILFIIIVMIIVIIVVMISVIILLLLLMFTTENLIVFQLLIKVYE